MAELFSASARVTSDLVAIFEVGIACMLPLGLFVVRRGPARAHMLIQSSMVLVNVPVVLIWMMPRYLSDVLPDLASEFLEPAYLFPTVMLTAGAIAEALGIYILLVAGTNLLPETWRFRRYKLWMRTELTLWWSVALFGLATYYFWYSTNGLS